MRLRPYIYCRDILIFIIKIDDLEGVVLKDNDVFDDFDDDDQDEMIVIVDEDGTENVCIVLDSAEHKGSTYLLVTPFDAENDNDENFDAIILKEIGEDGTDNVSYAAIEDDNEFNEIAAIFMAREDDYELTL